MKIRDNLAKYAVVAVLAGGVGIWLWRLTDGGPSGPGRSVVRVDVTVPELSAQALAGKAAFDDNCAACHGPNASGTKQGPPLVHDIYNPGHHADEAFFVAAKLGVRQHHWPYGNMPAQPQVTADQIRAIVAYVRELQVANGIVTRPHRM